MIKDRLSIQFASYKHQIFATFVGKFASDQMMQTIYV